MKNSNAIVAAVSAMFCFTMLSVVLVAVLVPDRAEGLITLMIGAMATTVPAVIGLSKITGVERQVTDLTNGLMDSKIRAGVADVLPDHLVDDTARPLIERDRARRQH